MIDAPAQAGTNAPPPAAGQTWVGRGPTDLAIGIALLILKWLALLALAIFILGPLIVMSIWAFAGEWTGTSLLPQVWSFKWWPDVFNLSGITDAIQLSLETATIVMLCSTLICLPAAYALAR